MFTQAIHTAVVVSATALPAGATPDNAQRRAVADVAKGPVEILVTTFEETAAYTSRERSWSPAACWVVSAKAN